MNCVATAAKLNFHLTCLCEQTLKSNYTSLCFVTADLIINFYVLEVINKSSFRFSMRSAAKYLFHGQL